MSLEPALRFFLRYAEAHGATVLEGEDEALLHLPEELQRDFSLPKELAVTSDSEVAQEGGQLLVIAGHPLLEAAAERVLKEGDAGWQVLDWPRSAPPAREVLLEGLRAFYPVEHGRIDLVGEPESVYTPLLRIGALVSYSGEGDFLERIEALFDADAALPLAEDTGERLLLVPQAQAMEVRSVLAPRIPEALEAGMRELERRAQERASELQTGAMAAMREELERARDYYAAQLAQIARRRESAAAERQALYDEQARVTAEESERRRREIEEKYRVGGAVRPFRLHLLLAPALRLELDVRRGERRYPLVCTYLLDGQAFLPLRCPNCGAPSPLVAGRTELGCLSCQAAKSEKSASEAAASEAAKSTAKAKAEFATSQDLAGQKGLQASQGGKGKVPPAPQAVRKGPLGKGSSRTAWSPRPAESEAAQRRRQAQVGIVAIPYRDPLPGSVPLAPAVTTFFRAVLGGGPSPLPLARHAPLDLALRWFGWRGLHLVLDLPYPDLPDERFTVTQMELLAGHHLMGRLNIGREKRDFTLFTMGSAPELTLWELLPARVQGVAWLGAMVDAPLPRGLDEMVQRRPPPSGLDEVEWLLLSEGAPGWHLAFILRAVSFWRMIGRKLPGTSPRAAASGLLEVAFTQSRLLATEGQVAGVFQADVLRSRQAAEEIGKRLPRLEL